MRPCEVFLKTTTSRRVCPCLDYVGDNTEPCQSCGHDFGRHGILEEDSRTTGTIDLSTQASQSAGQGIAGSNTRSIGITSLLDQRLGQAGVLHSRILSASNEANAGLRGSKVDTKRCVIGLAYVSMDADCLPMNDYRSVSSRFGAKRGNNKLGAATSRKGGGDVEDIVEIAGIFAYPLGLQHNVSFYPDDGESR